MTRDVIVINRDDASRACAKAISEFVDNLKSSDGDAEACAELYAMKIRN